MEVKERKSNVLRFSLCGVDGSEGDECKRLTLRDFWNTYQYRLRNKPNTRDQYELSLRHVADWMDKPVDEITGPMLAELHGHLTVKRGKRGGPAVANRVIDIIGYIYKVGLSIHRGQVGDLANPVDYITNLRMRNPKKTKLGCHIPLDRFAEWWQAVERYESMTDPWNSKSDLLKFLVLTGLRRGESTKIQWSQVDFRSRLILFDGHENKSGKQHVLPISTKVLRLLAERRECAQGKYVFGNGLNPEEVVSSIKNCYDSIGRSCGIKFTPHDLRRTFLLLLDSACMDVSDLELRRYARDICTHTPESDVLMQHYLLVNPERLRPLMQRVSRYVDYLLLQANLKENEKPPFPTPR